MKLLTKININFLVIISTLCVLTTVIGYFIIKQSFNSEIREDILETESYILNQIKMKENLPSLYPKYETFIVKGDTKKGYSNFKKIFLEDIADDNELEPYLEYTAFHKINGLNYKVVIREAFVENEELILTISLPLLLLLISVFVISYFINRKLQKKLWRDFQANLKSINNFSFSNNKSLKLIDTNIHEFDELNDKITKLADKLINDYNSLKSFTENASHELQTPISIILVNLEEILQKPELNESTFKSIVEVQKILRRLSALNKTLLKLAKLENYQYNHNEHINITLLVKNKIEEYDLLIKHKKLKVQNKIKHDFICSMDTELAETLINNLFLNSINHNTNGGEINIINSKNELKICNSGLENNLTNNTIFDRFTKHNSKSFGLGLAIVKQICNLHNLSISYSKSNYHCFVIKKLKVEN